MDLASECGALRTDALATNLAAAEAAKAADDAEARARGDELRQRTGLPWIGVVSMVKLLLKLIYTYVKLHISTFIYLYIVIYSYKYSYIHLYIVIDICL